VPSGPKEQLLRYEHPAEADGTVVRPEPRLRLLSQVGADAPALVESYRRLADVFHEVLAEQSLDALLLRIADALADLIPHDSLSIYEADEAQQVLRPVLVRDQYADEIMRTTVRFDEGITGWAARHREATLANQAHLDPRVRFVPGTPIDPEALISIPLVARARIKGVLNIYRLGDDGAFEEVEFELAKRFADAAALALDNAEVRERLEHQARTDSLTGLFNHRSFHEQLLEALLEASRLRRPVAVLMLDIDDFKRVNDVHGHGVGDELLRLLADALRATVRPNDVVCRLGGEEFAVIMSGCDADDAMRVADRIAARLAQIDLPAVGSVSVSMGLARGPEDAMNPRELAACAEAAMMTAKARGKNRAVLYEEGATTERPDAPLHARDVRSLAHMKMLQSLSGKLNRLNDVREIGAEVADELRSLIDYHNCRVFVVDGDEIVPIAFRGELGAETEAVPLELLRGRVGVGVTGRCVELGESLLIGDAANCEFGNLIAGTPVIEESLLAVPLRYGTRVVGAIVVSKLGLDQFDEDDLRLLEVLSGHAAVALENAGLYEAARREARSATALLEFGRELAAVSGLEEILQRVVELTSSLLSAPRTSIWVEEADRSIVVRTLHGYSDEQHDAVVNCRLSAERGWPTRSAAEPFVLTASEYERSGGIPLDPTASYAFAPTTVAGRRGWIVAAAPAGHFGERELRLFGGLAHQAKLAIANASNFEGLERTFVSTVEALANALEANDEYTSTHARWISDLSLRVGRRLGLDAPTLKRLELGALLHDIGKIGIPSSILSKSGRLTADERRLIESHPALGEQIIAPIDRLQSVCPIVRHCHERWDGRGYPDGLAGTAVPLESRIIFVCDAYHAMTTDRPYRKRLSHPEALRRLREGAGTQFDADIVEICIGVLGDSRDARPPR
jgi:diguanylate cyclase (GGDEF)-like protein